MVAALRPTDDRARAKPNSGRNTTDTQLFRSTFVDTVSLVGSDGQRVSDALNEAMRELGAVGLITRESKLWCLGLL